MLQLTKQITAGSLKQKLFFRAKLAGIITMEERGLNELINDIESDELFKSLLGAGIVKYYRHPNWELASDFLKFDDAIFHSSTSDSDISEMIENNNDIIPVIRKLGIERFKSLFLSDERMDENKIASVIKADVPTVRKIIKLINDVSVLSEFFHPSNVFGPGIRYTKTARIDIDGGRVICGYYSPNMARGKYSIDREKFAAFRSGLNIAEKKKAAELLSAIVLINSRKSIVHDIVSSLAKLQYDYFSTGEACKLKVLSAKELSRQINISESSISRAIFRKSVVTPQNIELPIRTLLPHKKQVVIYILGGISDTRSGYTDEQTRRELLVRHGISVSRRTVCLCRNELKP